MSEIIYSMTGFGRAEKSVGENHVLVEIKSLNGKQLDCNIKYPPMLKSYEFDIRNLLAEKLVRGSVDCNITVKINGAQRPSVINLELLKAYYRNLQSLQGEIDFNPSEVVAAILRLPEVVQPIAEVIADSDWQLVKEVLTEACNKLLQHRAEEGAVLKADIESRITTIKAHTQMVEEAAPNRQERIRESIQRKMDEWLGKDKFDQNRLEQEIIYYIEKMDISEELTRLKNHCDYFHTIMAEPGIGKGKKLGFIMQEIGREVNTTGAKAYDAEMQKLVVLMKDELEKAKEQTLNIL